MVACHNKVTLNGKGGITAIHDITSCRTGWAQKIGDSLESHIQDTVKGSDHRCGQGLLILGACPAYALQADVEYAGDVPYQVVGVPVLFCEGADEVAASVLFFMVGEFLYYEIFRDLSYGSAGAGCGGGVYCYACVLFDVGGC